MVNDATAGFMTGRSGLAAARRSRNSGRAGPCWTADAAGKTGSLRLPWLTVCEGAVEAPLCRLAQRPPVV